jgi:hypothetical protein
MTKKEQLKEQIRQQYWAGEYDFEEKSFDFKGWNIRKTMWAQKNRVSVVNLCNGDTYDMSLPESICEENYVKAVYAFAKVVRGL